MFTYCLTKMVYFYLTQNGRLARSTRDLLNTLAQIK
jgi:hypothetical protein